jgi:hypothetical protein
MIRNLVIAIAAVAAAGCSGSGGKIQPPVETTESEFRPGQEWAYRTRPGEESSTLTILRVERAPELGAIVHVAIEGLAIRNPANPAQPIRSIGHLPMSEAAVQQSVTRKLRDDAPLPDFEEGYQMWRRAYDSGKGGIFSIPVAEAVATVAGTLPQ